MSAPNNPFHISVTAGPDTGRRIDVPPAGVRIGRSPQNDVEMTDPAVSRFQCRIFSKPDGYLWVADLGSTNTTLLNGRPVVEARLEEKDVIEIGDSKLSVVSSAESPAPAVAQPAAEAPVIDLGLEPASAAAPTAGTKRWLWVLILLAILIAPIPFIKKLLTAGGTTASHSVAAAASLNLYFEKVSASADNIFRYELRLANDQLSVRIDNLSQNQHIQREKKIDGSILGGLQQDLDGAGFFDLSESYEGLAPNVYESADLTVVAGARSLRVRVLNRVEPEAFQRARQLVEDFARNELGLAAVSLPADKLLELARDAVLQGQKLHAEREVKYGNLAAAIKSFEEAQWYLESIEPKPDFYATAVSGLEECKRLLAEQHDSHRFQADRAIKLRDWATAAQHLRVIEELIPDRSDERHEYAERMLLDVERRLKK